MDRVFRVTWAVLALSAAMLPCAAPAEAHGRHDHHLVVKYRAIDACVHCMVEHGVPFARFTRTSSLDALHARLGVRKAEAVFLQHHTLKGGRSAAWTTRRSAATGRAVARASRRPADAQATDLSGVYELELPRGADVAAAAATLAADPHVVYAEPVRERRVSYTPNDRYLGTTGSWGQSFPDLWGLHATGAPALWDTTGGAGVVVAVVDTGVHASHKDLAANVWRNGGEIPRNKVDDDGNGYVDDDAGWDFIRESGKVKDKNGHGTHVAGTVAAVGDNAIGVAGMAWQSQIMNLRAFDERGTGRSTDIAPAILYAAENGADVINNSWGGFGPPDAVIADAITAAVDLGVVVVFAAGNEGRSDYALGEANLPNVIAVAATTPSGGRASFSNYGDAIAVAAPGVDVLSTRGSSSRVGGTKLTGKYLRLSGTSMAAPHVAGLAALLLSARPDLTVDEVRWHLELNADQPGYPGFEGAAWNPYFGWGRIDAAAVLNDPPVTTRVKLNPTELHAFAGAVTPDVARLAVRFTTEIDEDVAWSFTGPAGVTGAPAAGNGDASVAVAIDATGMSPGTTLGSAAVTAPSTADGGAARPVRVELHAETRIGDPIRIQDDVLNGSDAPAAGSNGSTTLVAWSESASGLKAATLANDGTVVSPITLRAPTCDPGCWFWPSNFITIGSDGTDFLVVYRAYQTTVSANFSSETRREFIHALRVRADGTLVDGAPLDVATLVQTGPRLGSHDGWLGHPRVTFDGSAYVVIWNHNRENGNQTDTSTTWLRRVPAAGPLGSPPVQVYPRPATGLHQIIDPDVACVAADDCVVAWIESSGDTLPGGTIWERNLAGVRVAGGAPVGSGAELLLENALLNGFVATRLVAHPGGYAVMALRNSCDTSTTTLCGYDAVAGLVHPNGTAVDPAGFRLNARADDDLPYCRPVGMTFDGTNFVAVYTDLAIDGLWDATRYPRPWFPGSPLFAARFSPTGTVLDHEDTGRLVFGGDTALEGDVVQSGVQTVVAWTDRRDYDSQHSFSIWAQRLAIQ